MIDPILTREQFADLDAATVARLMAAVDHDFTTWTTRLVDAGEKGDTDGARRARHALSGLCGAFGAAALQQASADATAGSPPPAALAAICAATLAAIRDIARDVRG